MRGERLSLFAATETCSPLTLQKGLPFELTEHLLSHVDFESSTSSDSHIPWRQMPSFIIAAALPIYLYNNGCCGATSGYEQVPIKYLRRVVQGNFIFILFDIGNICSLSIHVAYLDRQVLPCCYIDHVRPAEDLFWLLA
jgi:hypothetical protein